MPVGKGLRRRQKGFTYLWVLLTVALLGVSGTLVGEVWKLQARREKEQELLRIGHEFREAIRHYYQSSPGGKAYPPSLEDLVHDPRFPGVQRYLRRIYRDPVTGKSEWGVVRVNEGIAGVYSLSNQAPIKIKGFDPQDGSFELREHYAEWIFAYPHDLLLQKAPSLDLGPKALP